MQRARIGRAKETLLCGDAAITASLDGSCNRNVFNHHQRRAITDALEKHRQDPDHGGGL